MKFIIISFHRLCEIDNNINKLFVQFFKALIR